MKKAIVYLILCVFGLCSKGQGTAYITRSGAIGYSQFVRQYTNCSGCHITYFSDTPSGGRGYIGITDVYNSFKYMQICQNCKINDIEVLDDIVYFCGQTVTNRGLLGWIDIITMKVTIDSISLSPYDWNNIEVYKDAVGDHYVAGYSTDGSVHKGFNYKVQSYQGVIFDLQYMPCDMTLTNSFIVFVGDLTVSGFVNNIIIQPVLKYSLSPTYMPYYSYQVGSPAVNEPYLYHVRVVDIGNDAVATLTHRFEYGSYCSMALREFDLSNAYINFNVPMTTAYQAKYYYSFGDIYDFRYDVANLTYNVFQRYAVTPSNYYDVVTKIDFSSGTPTTVQSDYLSFSGQAMKSMSLSDSSMYVVYGYDVASTENVFWKDFQNTSVTGACLHLDILPFAAIPLISAERTDVYVTPINWGRNIVPSVTRLLLEAVSTICH